MATRRYKINPGEHNVDAEIVSEAGAAVNSKGIEVTVELASSFAYDAAGALRQINKQEVIDGLHEIIEYITNRQWPPA